MTTLIVPTSPVIQSVDDRDERRAVSMAAEQADGLRRLADLIETNPELAKDLRYALTDGGLVAPIVTGDGQRDRMAAAARAASRAGAKVGKKAHDNGQFVLSVAFGAVLVKFVANRGEVCERVVTGTREVTEEVPDPDALAAVPKVTVTKTVEDVEWVCGSLLAPTADGAA